MGVLTCIAKLVAVAGSEDKVKAELAGLLEPTRNEAGCINYDMHVDNDAPHIFMFYENWASAQDLDKHLESDHIKACFSALEGLLVSVDVQRLSRVTP